MKQIEPIFKWICLVMAIALILIGAYHWRDNRYEQAVQQRDSFAVGLSQMNYLIPETNRPLISNVNQILELGGRPDLMREIPQIAVPDSVGGK